MTASIKEREDSYVTVDYVEDQEIKPENKKRQLNQLKETLCAKEERNPSQERTG